MGDKVSESIPEPYLFFFWLRLFKWTRLIFGEFVIIHSSPIIFMTPSVFWWAIVWVKGLKQTEKAQKKKKKKKKWKVSKRIRKGLKYYRPRHRSQVEKKASNAWWKYSIPILYLLTPGGTCIGRWYGDVPRSRPSFARPVGTPYSLPIYHQSTARVPPVFNFYKNFAFSALFVAKISALKTQIFKIFVPKTPHFSRKIRFLDPTFGNPCDTQPPRKNWVPPSPVLTKLPTHLDPGIWTSWETSTLYCIVLIKLSKIKNK